MDLSIAHLPREKPTRRVSVAGSLDRVHLGPEEPPTVAVATRDPLSRQRRSRYASRTLRLGLRGRALSPRRERVCVRTLASADAGGYASLSILPCYDKILTV